MPHAMLRAFSLSVAQLGDRKILRVLALSLAVTLALFALLGGATWWGTRLAIAAWAGSWSGEAAALIATLVGILALWLLFRAVGIAVIGLFADGVVEAVEARHYPAAAAASHALPFHRSLGMGVRSAARVVAVNLLLLPVYLVLLATGIGTAALFFVVNAWLLGRDLTDMVATRHLPAPMVRGWSKANRAGRFVLGLAVTGLFVVPVLNILAPVIGAAMATHFFHRGRA